jgi:uncharacterized protein
MGLPMVQTSWLALNPRVSVLRHNGGIYLFDPVTRTCASLNEAMLAFLKKPGDVGSFGELRGEDRKRLSEVIQHLGRLGILQVPESEVPDNRISVPKEPAATTRLHIFVTTKCNLRCAYCYAQGGDSAKTISQDIWHLAMDHFFANLYSGPAQRTSKHKTVNLSIHGGGEPTVEFAVVRKIASEFCGRARAAGLSPSLLMGTNGTYGDSVHRWIIANGVNVSVSLDGPSAVQNRLRPFRTGQPSYDLVARNLQALVKAGRRVSIRATITDESMETMEDTLDLARQLGLAAVHFEPVTLTGRGAVSALSRPDAEQFCEKFLKCFRLGLKHNIDVKYSGLHCFGNYHQRFCSACGQNFCVTPDGNITTCYEVLDSRDPAAGTFFIGKVDPAQKRVVLDQARIEKLKRRVADNMKACQGCFLRYQCAGDCPAKSFRYSNRDLYSPDPFRCQISQRINRALIAWLADGVIEPRDAGQARIVSFNARAARTGELP